MAKKRKNISKNGPVFHLSAEENTLRQMPHFNGHACGHGVHGDTKYNRTKANREWRRSLEY